MDSHAAQTARTSTSHRQRATATQQAKPTGATHLTAPAQLATTPRVDTLERRAETRLAVPGASLSAASQTTTHRSTRATFTRVQSLWAQVYATHKQAVAYSALLLGAAVGVACVVHPGIIAAYVLLSGAAQLGLAVAAAVMSYCAVRLAMALYTLLPATQQTVGMTGGALLGASVMAQAAPLLGPAGVLIGLVGGGYVGYALASQIDDPKALAVGAMLGLTALFLQRQAAQEA